MESKPIALQLYSLRKDVYPGGDDLIGVLKTVAEIGYAGVEPAGLHGNDPNEIAKIIKDLGLQVCSAHTSMPTKENAQELIDTYSALGTKRIISGVGADDTKTVDACKASAARFEEAAALLRPHGIEFGFHNHWWEFITLDGKYAYDILLEEAPSVFSELDVYWCAFGHANPVEVIGKHKSRQPLLHIKDGMLEESKRTHTAVGSGKLDFASIIGVADPNVLDWLIVEIDACEIDMLEAVRQSYGYLTSRGLAKGNV